MTKQEKKESYGHGKLVSPVIGGWAPSAPSPTTGAAGHDVAAAKAALRANIDGVAFPFASAARMGGSVGGVVLFRATAAGR